MKKLAALLLSLAMVFALVSCGSSTTTSDSSKSAAATSGSASASEEADGSAATPASGDKYAVILKTQATDYWVKMWNGVEAYAKENNLNVDLYAAQSDSDYEGQLAIMENCINDGGYVGIAVAPCSAVNMISGVKKANDAGIVVVNIDEQFDVDEMTSQSATCSGYVASDNVAVGNAGASYLCEQLEKGSQVAVIEGIAGNISSEDRASGAKQAFEDAGMEIVGSKNCDWDMQTAMDTAAAWITQYPDLKAIYCCNDGMAMGVKQAIANAGKTGEILLCGTDGDADAVSAVANNEMAATVAQDSTNIGVTGLKLLIEACADSAKYPASANPEKTPVEAVVVTVDNAADWQ